MKKTVKKFLVTALMVFATMGRQHTEAAVPLAILKIIEAGVKKVIVAVDLQIQRQQNRIIWLQNAQKVIENTMSKLRLDEISEWTDRQRNLYRDYFEELNRVKSMITYYKSVKEITAMQARMVAEYQKVWRIIVQDGNFTEEEKLYMGKVYSGMLMQSAKNMEEMLMVVNSFRLQMGDAQRLEAIHNLEYRVQTNVQDLLAFNRQNAILSIARSREQKALETTKDLYGIN
jgi:hypothetical protein